jgi:hypothetical protein
MFLLLLLLPPPPRYLALDEADRMVDLGFEEEVGSGCGGGVWGGGGEGWQQH